MFKNLTETSHGTLVNRYTATMFVIVSFFYRLSCCAIELVNILLFIANVINRQKKGKASFRVALSYTAKIVPLFYYPVTDSLKRKQYCMGVRLLGVLPDTPASNVAAALHLFVNVCDRAIQPFLSR